MILLDHNLKVLLFDIEGTTSSIEFVHDVLFPYARQQAHGFLTKHWANPEIFQLAQKIINEAHEVLKEVFSQFERATPDLAYQAVCQLMDRDAKVTGLKQLQGLIWQEGYAVKRIHSHLYAEVPEALMRFKRHGFRLFTYSSGSIQAQKLYFQHTTYGDLLALFEGHFDTTSGNKGDRKSYIRISDNIGVNPTEICFFTDAFKEIVAARQASLQTVWVVRPGNVLTETPEGHGISNFDELSFDFR